MKVFVAYRFTGEDPRQLEPLLTAVRDALTKAGVSVYCTYFDEAEFKDQKLGPKQIMGHAFEVIDESDALFVIQTSEARSEGMLIEAGYCLAKGIPIIAATKNGVSGTYLPDLAGVAFTWQDAGDLSQKITALDFSNI